MINEVQFNEKPQTKNIFNAIICFSYIIIFGFIGISYLTRNLEDTKEFVLNYRYKGYIPPESRKIIIYSCLIGNYDNVTTFQRQKGYDYILFTDQKIMNTNWTIMEIPSFVRRLKVSDVKKQRFIKIHPHLLFKNYDLSIYIDANYVIKGDMDDFLINTLNPLDHIYICHLQFGTDTRNAILKAIEKKLDDSKLLKKVLERYDKEKIFTQRGIANAGMLVRKHHEKDVIKLMDEWWKEVKKYSHVDGFGFNYAANKTQVRFLYISYQFTLDYFDHNQHLKKIDYP